MYLAIVGPFYWAMPADAVFLTMPDSFGRIGHEWRLVLAMSIRLYWGVM